MVSGVLVNNGHAPTLAINKPQGTATLTGGPLGNSVYKLQQLHFHFGCDDDKGSEHTVNGEAYSGEVLVWSNNRMFLLRSYCPIVSSGKSRSSLRNLSADDFYASFNDVKFLRQTIGQ